MNNAIKFREIFIFVLGATPQIVTETIFALAMQDPKVHPDELYFITTVTGKKIIKKRLFEESILKEMCNEYDIECPTVSEESFLIISDREGRKLEDIRTISDNEAAGNIISAFIQRKVAEPDTRIHCSLAGGRKTMSFYLGAALQLFGRPHDKLYHILVSPEFESNPAFYYPPTADKLIPCRAADGTTSELNARDAKIDLADLSYIRLGEFVPKQNLDSFSEMVRMGQREIDTASQQIGLVVNITDSTLCIGRHIVELVPMQLMLYLAFLRQKTDHCKYPDREYCRDCTGCYETMIGFSSRDALVAMAKDYAAIYSNKDKEDYLYSKWPDGIEIPSLRVSISKMNKSILEQLGDETLATYYIVRADRRYAASRYGIKLEKTKIRFLGNSL